ncbi:SDR family NAD(P)-dependent oxidoreductase [Crenalkalicoccus roseus]|uniref:SDR family NAD(P)-dependent oxidoreductase n=1 Tax=Crenalkalicoccus roseus TaxID=1485588 RepID=UPI001081B93F|nr:glucose 1-dehydrogenase [Crenalkalicoccus roseus]
MRLKDLVAIVTGADSGIGRAIAETFARESADIAILYHRDRDGAEETADRVRAAGRRALLVQGDVGSEEDVERLFREAEAALGPPFLLVNNAGIGQDGSEVAEMDPAQFDRILRTNLRGPFLCCRAFVRARRRQGGRGRVINITSVHERIPSPGAAAYGAAKGGLLAFTRSLCLEVAEDRINVNAIAPGLIHTPMTAERVEDPKTMEEELPNIPWRRPGRPEEVARLALYLASDEADYVTGQSFTIDGGLTMNWGQGA